MVRIKKVMGKPRGGAEAPFSHCGSIEITEETAREHNLVASFIEECWQRQSGKDFATSKAFTTKKAVLFVSAKTKKRLNDFLAWTIKIFMEGIAQQGERCELVS